MKFAIATVVLVACFVSMATAGKGGPRGHRYHRGQDAAPRLAAQLLGECRVTSGKYLCRDCPNAKILKTVSQDFGWWGTYEFNITACAEDCGRIECVAADNDNQNCICPPEQEDTTCGFGSECDGCDSTSVTTMFGWKVCCKGCSSPTVSFSVDPDNDSYHPKPLCTCNSGGSGTGTGTGTGTGSVDP